MILVKIEIKRCQAGYTYSLLRVLSSPEELERMQLEYPFPLTVLKSSFDPLPLGLIKDSQVDNAPGWYYLRPRVFEILKLEEV